jgi:hypothetical protein
VQNLGLVAGLGADKRCGLKAALERTRDDEIELHVESVEDVGELETVFFAFFVEGAFQVKQWIRPAHTGTGVAKDIQIHNLFIF